MSRNGAAHINGDCWAPTCPICADEAEHGWRCEAHDVVTAGDCPECDAELIALAEQVDRDALRPEGGKS